MIGPSISLSHSVGSQLVQLSGLGPELIPDGSFDVGVDGWIPGLTSIVAHVDGRLRITNPGGPGVYAKAQRSVGVLEAGVPYRLVVGESVFVSGNKHRVGIGPVPSPEDDVYPVSILLQAPYQSGFNDAEADFVPTSSVEHFLFLWAQDHAQNTEVHYDNISLRRILA
ncbi:MAG: hypothetical protein HEP70_12705 [Rhodobiaceae bacterium]|nr:hypothetical protein [Rhodobiaceae bacterium]